MVNSEEQDELALPNQLAGYLKSWAFRNRRVECSASFEPMFPGKEEWVQELFEVYGNIRHKSAHGDFSKAMQGDLHETVEKLGRLAGFVNILIAAKAGYNGPILESPIADGTIELSTET